MKYDYLLDELLQIIPEPKCELTYYDDYSLLIAVVLSAQTTDVAVNKVTPLLFDTYPDVYSLANANIKDIENIIKNIGLYRNKAKNINSLANIVINEFDGKIPNTMSNLIKLPGVGRKTANVLLGEYYNIPSFPVDTHVERLSKRFKLAKECDDVLTIEHKLKRKFSRDRWNQAHHLLILYGRYYCKAKNPRCNECILSTKCNVNKKANLK